MGVYWVTLACLILISHNSITVEGKPGLLHHHNHHTSNYGAVAGSSDPAFSASSYDSLGIQPTRSGRNQYWWQGPQSPFGEGVAQNQGISSGSSSGRPQQTVIGCSGNGCDSPLFSGPAVASSSSSSFSGGGGGGHSGSSYGNSGSGGGGGGGGGGSCCNFFWQKPGHPCSTHQGNDCPRGFSCVNYRSCSNGVISSHASSGYASKRPSTSELMSFGRPCGSSGTEVCCEDAPSRPQQPVVQQPSYTYYPPAAPAPPQQPVVQQPPNTYFPPTPAAPATTPRPVYNPPPVTYTPAPPAYQPPPPPVYTPSPPAYKPPPPPVYTTAPPVYQPPPPPVFTTPVYRPTTTRPRPPPPPPPTQPSVAQGPPANLLPYPGCAAALKCVPEEYCSVDGIMINTPVFLTEQQKEFRVPLMACLNIDTNQVGFCCRDPLYNDPWPADMPMPNMPAKPPPTVQPVVVQTTAPPPPPPPPTQPPFIYCYSSQDCVLPEVCSARQQPFNNQPNARCETFTGQAGVCCNRPPPTTTTTTTTTTPPPPPTTQPVVIAPPPDSYLPPPPPQPVVNVPDLSYLPPPPPEPVVAPSDTYLPPPLPTKPPVEVLPPPPPPPTQQPVIEQSYIPPPPPPTPQPVIEQSYIPPPPPPQQPVIEQSYIPPPPPAAASQVLEPQCGVSRPVSHQMLGIGEAALGEMPWHAMIAHANGTMTCSGALIGQKFVATSHHCVHGANPASLRVRLGEQRAGANDEPLPHYEIPVMAIIGHPEFEDGALFHDVAVLALAAPAPSGQAHIAPICLPSQNEPQGSQCVVSGWGHDTLSGLQIGMLNRIQVDLVRNNDCQTSLQTTHLGKYFKLHKSFTCASTQHSINPCKVDGGSPLACKRPDGSHVLIGLSSWSVGCSNQQQPGVYADVAAVAPWMQQQMSQPEANLVEQSNSAFHQQQQTQQQQHFPSNSGLVASYGR